MSNLMSQYLHRLESNPKYRYGTINNYRKAIAHLIKNYGENPSIDELNRFISEKSEARQFYAKYSLKDYLSLIGREMDYYNLVPANMRKPERQKHYLQHEVLLDIIKSITNEKYRDIGLLQFAFAGRAFEVITIEAKKVKKERYKENNETKERIRVILMGKGDKPRPVFLRIEMAALLQKYYKNGKRFLFLDESADTADKKTFFRMVHSSYLRYLHEVQEAGRKCGHELNTHDIRRSVSTMAYIYDDRKIQMPQALLGHDDPGMTERYIKDDTEKVSEFLLQHQLGI